MSPHIMARPTPDHVGHNKTTIVSAEAAGKSYHFDDIARHIHTCVEQLAPEAYHSVAAYVSVFGPCILATV